MRAKPAFRMNSKADSTLLGPLTSCKPEMLFNEEKNNLPLALSLYIPKNLGPDYSHLLIKEISLYAEKFGSSKAQQTWLRGTPLYSLSSAEITEISFLTASHFQMDEDSYSEYGFECSLNDINENNLALMKGLRFTTLSLNLDIQTTPKETEVETALKLIKKFNFRDIHCHLNTGTIDQSKLNRWLHLLSNNKVSLIEIIGLKAEISDAIPLDKISKDMKKRGYILLGDRFFVKEGHPLARSKQKNKLQYIPNAGISHQGIEDWLGIGIGAIGKVGHAYYQNVPKKTEYVANLTKGKLPICCSGQHLTKESMHTWELAQQLYCLHQIQLPNTQNESITFKNIQETLSNACKNGWMYRKGNYFYIKNNGLNHIREICNSLQAY